MSHVQSQSIVPARRKVSDINLVIASAFPLTSQKQPLLRCQLLLVDVTDCEPQYQRPYQAEYDFPLPINHVFRADVRDLNGQPLMESRATLTFSKR